MKHKMMKAFKRSSAMILSLFTACSSTLTGLGSIVPTADVKASSGTATVKMSKERNSFKISELNRPMSEGLWKISAGSHQTFCLDSGKSMCNGDTVEYKTANAVTYKDQSIAKALTYYENSSKNNKAFALTQAYIWACGKGKSKQTVVYQAGKNLDSGYSTSDAKKFCKKINDSYPEGTIYYYNVKKCVKGKKHNSHQKLYRLDASSPHEHPKHKSLKESYQDTKPKEIQVSVKKRDTDTGATLAGATFLFYCDNVYMGKATTNDEGIASFTYSRMINSGKLYSGNKTYVTNWKSLSHDQQAKATKNGWYDSEAKAKKAALKEAKKKVSDYINSKMNETHVWSVKEADPPFGHLLNDTSQTKQEGKGKKTKLKFSDVSNTWNPVHIHLHKQSDSKDLGVEASYKGAIYGIYAKEDILSSDNKTVLYKAGTEVGQITTNDAGNGSSGDLHPGNYYLKEIKAPRGFKVSSKEVEVVLNNDDKTVPANEQVYTGKLSITKYYQDGDEKVPEPAAEFEVRNKNKKLVDTIITDDDGVATTKELPYGSYYIHQTKGKVGYEMATDMYKTIEGSDENEIPIYHFEAYNRKQKAPFVKVVYLTTAPKSNHPAHVKVQCGKPGTALCEKSQTISKSFLENYIGTLTEEEMFQIDRGIQIGYGIKNNVYDYDNEEDSFVKDIANYIQEMDHLLSKLCDLKELDQKARHIDIEQLLGKDVIALGRILPDSGLEAVRAAMVSQADKEQKKIREKLELMIGKR